MSNDRVYNNYPAEPGIHAPHETDAPERHRSRSAGGRRSRRSRSRRGAGGERRRSRKRRRSRAKSGSGSPAPRRTRRQLPGLWDSTVPAQNQAVVESMLMGDPKTRELYIGHLAPGCNPRMLEDLFNMLFQALPEYKQKYSDQPPVIKAQMYGNGTFAFVEFRSKEVAQTAIKFDQCVLMNHPLHIGRPQGFVPPPPGQDPPTLDITPLLQAGLIPSTPVAGGMPPMMGGPPPMQAIMGGPPPMGGMGGPPPMGGGGGPPMGGMGGPPPMGGMGGPPPMSGMGGPPPMSGGGMGGPPPQVMGRGPLPA